MQLREIMGQIHTLRVEGPLDREVTGVTYDSRRLTPGMVFVAIPGHNVDGHQFISDAIDRGAAAIVCESNGFVSRRATKVKVSDTREALARLSAAFYQHPSTRLKVIGVTGTNGKTTVAFMIKHILELAGMPTGLIGTVRYEIGERVIPAQRTTPEALEIQQMMSQMVRAGCQACVMEVSSHSLDQKRVAEVEFDCAIFTNLTRDHLDYHGTMEAYYLAKKKLFQRRPGSAKTGFSVINIDDAYGERLQHESNLEVQLTYGMNEKAVIRATHLDLGPDSTRVSIQTSKGKISCRLKLIGRHNVYNALAAIGAALALDVPTDVIVKAMSTMTPVPGRLESVNHGQPFGVFVDYAHTDDALKNVLQTLREITKGRLLLLFGCGGNRDTGKRPQMGKIAAELADFTIITSDNPRKESATAIISQIEQGYREVRPDRYSIEVDRGRAIQDILRLATPADIVLIAGKGHETYQEFEDTVVPFDDRIHAAEALETMGYRARRRN
jgi:UDP-N-acetylmuramoyl-L-alanyl-D-glutamate--2,6-diaminopimelate ligase